MADQAWRPSECCWHWRGVLESGHICTWLCVPHQASSCARTRHTSWAGSRAPKKSRKNLLNDEALRWVIETFLSLFWLYAERSWYISLDCGESVHWRFVCLKIQTCFKWQVRPTGHEPNMKHQTAVAKSSFLLARVAEKSLNFNTNRPHYLSSGRPWCQLHSTTHLHCLHSGGFLIFLSEVMFYSVGFLWMKH